MPSLCKTFLVPGILAEGTLLSRIFSLITHLQKPRKTTSALEGQTSAVTQSNQTRTSFTLYKIMFPDKLLYPKSSPCSKSMLPIITARSHSSAVLFLSPSGTGITKCPHSISKHCFIILFPRTHGD